MDLYTDNNPKTTTTGLGFKNEQVAKDTLKKIAHRDKIYQKQVVITMFHRAKYHPYRNQNMEKAMDIFAKWMDNRKINYNKKSTGSGYKQQNIYDKSLEICSINPITGFYRDGYCNTGINDLGSHTVCAKVTNKFLKFSKSKGNNLIQKSKSFPGLKNGDRWCLCAIRWKEAYENDSAPPIIVNATNKKTINYIPKYILDKFAH
jgi:uncharacterized protein